ncbi:MAG TPA: Fur family transcriptional regulator [Ktedonobacterales bacterium]|jgi:Fur family ferric uptake transcriptional regulator|nr:Fur family transcriptional regulator [Ktedonobacterales bacterium]
MPTDDPGVQPSTIREPPESLAPQPASPHEGYTERLRRLGARVTPQRLFVLEALEAVGGHMTAEEIMRWASRRYPALNLATVYRTLDLLVSVGLVAQTELGGGSTSYELVGDSPHHHLACERCGYVIEMDEALLADVCARALDAYGFHAQPRHLAIFGLCRVCYDAEWAARPEA